MYSETCLIQHAQEILCQYKQSIWLHSETK